MYSVTKEIFEEFVKVNNLTRVLGKWWGDYDYINSDGVVRATASYGDFIPEECYVIDENKQQLIDFEFVSKLLNR